MYTYLHTRRDFSLTTRHPFFLLHSAALNTMQSLGLHSIDAGSIDTAIVQPDGFAPSPRVAVPAPGAADAPVPLRAAQQRGAATTCFLSHALHSDQAADHLLMVTAPLWVFNCTAVPIALRPASAAADDGGDDGAMAAPPLAPEHPWIMPYGGTGWAPHTASGRGAQVGPPGLEEVLEEVLAQREGWLLPGRAARPTRLASFRSDAALSRSLEQHVCRYDRFVLHRVCGWLCCAAGACHAC